jgi:replicative DNA helicase
MILTCGRVITKCYDNSEEVDSLLDTVEQQIFSITGSNSQIDMRATKEIVMEAIEEIEKLYENRGAITGLPTGFIELDRMTSGLHPAEMIVIAARPSMGKTAFAMNIAEHVALHVGKAVAVFSLEMSSPQLVQRMLCSRGKINLKKVRNGFLSERDFPALTAVAAKLAESPLFIDDTAGFSISELRAKARRLKSQHDIQLIVIDYLQLLRGSSRRSQENRQLEISEISAGIKALAKELYIPVIVIAQLNRQPELRGNGTPRLSDLRESGSIGFVRPARKHLSRQRRVRNRASRKEGGDGKRVRLPGRWFGARALSCRSRPSRPGHAARSNPPRPVPAPLQGCSFRRDG